MEEQQATYKITTFSDCWNQFMELQNRLEEEFRRDIINFYKTNVMKAKVKNTRKKKVVSKPVAQNLTPVVEEVELDDCAVDSISNSSSSKRTVAKTNVVKATVKNTRKKKVDSKPVAQNLLTHVEEEVELDNCPFDSFSSSRSSKRTVAKKAQEKISLQVKQTLNEKLRNNESTNKKTKIWSNESTCSDRKTNASDVSGVSEKEKDCNANEALPSCFVLLDRLPESKKDNLTEEKDIVNSNTSAVDIFGHPSGPEVDLKNSDNVPPGISTICDPNNDTVPNNYTVPVICVSSTTITEEKSAIQCDNYFVFPAPKALPERSSRVRTKNKKYLSDIFMTNIVPNKSANLSCTEAKESMNKSTNNTKGKKRKSDEEINVSTKHVKLSKEVKTVQEPNENEKKTEINSGSHSDVSSDKSIKDNLGSCEEIESSSKEVRSRTKVLNKPFNNNMVVIEPEAVSDDLPAPEIRVDPPSPTPVQRMTRTRTKELNKNQSQVDQSAPKAIALKIAAEIKCGKENKIGSGSKLMKSEKGHKFSPLSASNFLFSPSSTFSLSKVTPMKVNSAYKKMEGSTSKTQTDSASKLLPREAIALEKRNELIKAKTEEVKRKREEKEKRVLVSKQAVEHAKQLKLAKLQKDREEKERVLAEAKRMKEEQLLKKKQMADAMIKEAEERRLKEEEAKKARLLKQEEEKRNQAELRLKMAEDAKKLQEMRVALEAMENEARLISAEKKAKAKQKAVEVVSYELTPSKDASDYVPKLLKNEDDYGLSDDSGASTDDERQPKKPIPKWATKQCRSTDSIIQEKVSFNLINMYFPSVSNDPVELTNMECHRSRASSAVWNTPSTSF